MNLLNTFIDIWHGGSLGPGYSSLFIVLSCIGLYFGKTLKFLLLINHLQKCIDIWHGSSLGLGDSYEIPGVINDHTPGGDILIYTSSQNLLLMNHCLNAF